MIISREEAGLQATIKTIDDFKVFTEIAEFDEKSYFKLQKIILQQRCPKANTYDEALIALKKDLPLTIIFDENKTYNNGRVIVKEIE